VATPAELVELRDLEAFVVVGRTLHFSRASEQLNVAQSALSQRIRRLERRIGAELFVRTTRTVTLTAAGRTLLDRAQDILRQVEDAVAATQQSAQAGFERLVIGSTTGRPHATLGALLSAVRERYPLIEVAVRPATPTEQILTDLIAERLDLGFVWEYLSTPDGAAASHPGLTGVEIGRQPLHILMPSSHRLARRREVRLTDFADEGFVTYLERPGGSVFRSALFSLCREAGLIPRISEEAADGQILLLLVSSGAGVALLPPTYESIDIPGCAHVPLVDASPRLRYSIQHRTGDDRPPITLIRELIPDVLARTPRPATPSTSDPAHESSAGS
jgi:DNA-binding transcriptional LysR family regulator